MSITGAFIMPHPPLIIPEVGRGRQKEIQKTIDACESIAQSIAHMKPKTIVITSPHSVLYSDYFHISPGEIASGDMGQFGAPQVKFCAEYDEAFVKLLSSFAQKAGLPAGTLGERERSLDHAAAIPLYFINKYYTNYKLVRISLSGLPLADHYKLGMCICEAALAPGGDTVLIASGDLSHKLRADGPYGYAEEGVQFDKMVTEAMESGEFCSFFDFEPAFLEKAAECGLRSFVIMAGALDKKAVTAKLLSYEGPFGVGYAVSSFLPGKDDDNRAFLRQYIAKQRILIDEIRGKEDEYVSLARYSLEHFIKTGERAPLPGNLPSELTDNAAGVFVSLKKHGELRGCIGTIAPVTDSIAQEIMRNAVSSGCEDPRFDKVRQGELAEIVYSVDVLSPSEPIESAEMLDVRRYGVIVTSGRKRGLLLPNLEGVETVEQQLSIAKRKAGIAYNEDVKLERFEVIRHT